MMIYSIDRKKEACCYFEDVSLDIFSENTSIYDHPVYDQRVLIDIDYIYIPQDDTRDDLSILLGLYEPSTEEYNPDTHIKPKEKKKQSVWKRFIFLFFKSKYSHPLHKNGSIYMS